MKIFILSFVLLNLALLGFAQVSTNQTNQTSQNETNSTVGENNTASSNTTNQTNTTNTTTTTPPVPKCDPRCVQTTCSEGKCGTCQEGHQLTKDEKRCIRCPANCNHCSADNDCDSCKNNGDFLMQLSFSSGKQCVTCDSDKGVPNCTTCKQCDNFECKDFTAICSQCKTGFSSIRGKCLATVSEGNCSQFLTEKNVCLQCSSGFFKNSNGECEACSTQNCDSCKNGFACEKCKAGKVMSTSNSEGVVCVDDSDATTCDIENCGNCDKTKFHHKCIACSSGFQLLKHGEDDNGYCFECKSEYNCDVCAYNSPDACKQCKEGFFKVFESNSRDLSQQGTGTCLSDCPTNKKASNSDTIVAYFKNEATKTCLPCPIGWAGCNMTNSGDYVLVGQCQPGFVAINNGTDCKSCGKGCSACSSTEENATCTSCSANTFLEAASGLCKPKYQASTEQGKYIDLETNTTSNCPQANCGHCKGPDASDCLSCSSGFGLKFTKTATSVSSTCASCGDGCGKCRFNGDGSKRCYGCPPGLVGSWDKNDLTCSKKCPTGYFAVIDYAALRNDGLAAFLGVEISVGLRVSYFQDPVTKFLASLYQNIVPQTRTVDNGTETILYGNLNSPKVYSALDDTPIYYNETNEQWTIKHNGSSMAISLDCEICYENCISCPDSLPKFIEPNGTVHCLKKCPPNYEVNVTAGNVCVIPNDKLVVKIDVTSATDGVQDYLSDISANITSLNSLKIGAVTWTIHSAKSFLNKNLTEAEIIANLTANVTLNESILTIPKANFQSFVGTQIIINVNASAENNTDLVSKDQVSIYIDADSVLSSFTITPTTGVSADTKFTAEFAIKTEFESTLEGSRVKPHLLCFPQEEEEEALQARRLQANSANSTTSQNKSKFQFEFDKPDTDKNSENEEEEFDFIEEDGTIVKPKNDFSNFDSNFDPDQEEKEKEEKKLNEGRVKSETDKKKIREDYDSYAIISKYGKGTSSNITFVAPFSESTVTYSCMLFLEFGNQESTSISELRDIVTITVNASNMTFNQVFDKAKEAETGDKKIEDFNEKVSLISSLFLKNSQKNSSNSSAANASNFTCDKQGKSKDCCPPNNLCSGNGECVLDEEGGLVDNSTTVYNKNYYCQCYDGFAGINCETNSTIYNECTDTLELLLEEYEGVDDFESEDLVIDTLSTLETLGKTCISSLNGNLGLMKKVCSIFKKCTTPECIDVSISAIAEINRQLPFLSDNAFAPGAHANSTLTANQKNNALFNKRRFIADLEKCNDEVMAKAADITFDTTNETSKVYKKGSIYTLLHHFNETLGYNTSCSDISNETDFCEVEIPSEFGGSGQGDIRVSISPSSRDTYTDIEGGNQIVSDALGITLSKNGSVYSVSNSEQDICMELKILNPDVNKSLINCSFINTDDGVIGNNGCKEVGNCTKLSGDCMRCCCNHLTTFVLAPSGAVNNDGGGSPTNVCLLLISVRPNSFIFYFSFGSLLDTLIRLRKYSINLICLSINFQFFVPLLACIRKNFLKGKKF